MSIYTPPHKSEFIPSSTQNELGIHTDSTWIPSYQEVAEDQPNQNPSAFQAYSKFILSSTQNMGSFTRNSSAQNGLGLLGFQVNSKSARERERERERERIGNQAYNGTLYIGKCDIHSFQLTISKPGIAQANEWCDICYSVTQGTGQCIIIYSLPIQSPCSPVMPTSRSTGKKVGTPPHAKTGRKWSQSTVSAKGVKKPAQIMLQVVEGDTATSTR